jgi:hypothetical protein
MTERRRGSPAEDSSTTPTKRPPPPGKRRSSRPPPSGVTEHVSGRTPEYKARPTLSVSIVALGDIPTLLGRPPSLDDQIGVSVFLAAIDGDATVAELADRTKLDPEQARAIVAELVDKGIVALSRKTGSASGVGTVRTAPRSLDYWLAGLKPRTK